MLMSLELGHLSRLWTAEFNYEISKSGAQWSFFISIKFDMQICEGQGAYWVVVLPTVDLTLCMEVSIL